ncbi:hypothetical protein HYH03_013244 [Edaphochlamys debaryana]|uniref:Uncharacterized protein n=1 Tax=Edaphochlamys debaryana TaxID=47281 RepID=A0A835XZ16_9CHLO|nr:hypothetical protein HYH03_013244 [Edaphochlamys debaryana]|eukprot:KAG2488254.1 hypothetical protein HYH03_013244 [Edaphochlamys debaryana]
MRGGPGRRFFCCWRPTPQPPQKLTTQVHTEPAQGLAAPNPLYEHPPAATIPFRSPGPPPGPPPPEPTPQGSSSAVSSSNSNSAVQLATAAPLLLQPELVRRVAACLAALAPNDVPCALRLACRATASALRSPAHTTVRTELPVPAHALLATWAAAAPPLGPTTAFPGGSAVDKAGPERATGANVTSTGKGEGSADPRPLRRLSLAHRHRVLALAAAAGVGAPGLAALASAAGCPPSAEALQAAAAAGRLEEAAWVLPRLPPPRLRLGQGDALAQAAAAAARCGHGAVVDLLLEWAAEGGAIPLSVSGPSPSLGGGGTGRSSRGGASAAHALGLAQAPSGMGLGCVRAAAAALRAAAAGGHAGLAQALLDRIVATCGAADGAGGDGRSSRHSRSSARSSARSSGRSKRTLLLLGAGPSRRSSAGFGGGGGGGSGGDWWLPGLLEGAAEGLSLPLLREVLEEWEPVTRSDWQLSETERAAILAAAAASSTPDWAHKVEWLELQGCDVRGLSARTTAAAAVAAVVARYGADWRERLVWLAARGHAVGPAAADAAASAGNAEALGSLLQAPLASPFSGRGSGSGSESGAGLDPERPDWIQARVRPEQLDPVALLSAARRGARKVLEAVAAAGGAPQLRSAELLLAAVESGSVDLVGWLLEGPLRQGRGPRVSDTAGPGRVAGWDGCGGAASAAGNSAPSAPLESVAISREVGQGVEVAPAGPSAPAGLLSEELFAAAAGTGRAALLELLSAAAKAQGPRCLSGCPWGPAAVEAAAAAGSAEALTWLLAQGAAAEAGVPYAVAAAQGDEATLHTLRRLGVPLGGPLAFTQAVEEGAGLPPLAWLMGAGCEVDWEEARRAARARQRGNGRVVAAWLSEQRVLRGG